jgi:ferric-dicitrate binding protein FerR (iron transport regulator)
MRDKQSLPEFLDRSFARFRDLPEAQVEMACERVLRGLREEAHRASGEVITAPSRTRRGPGRLALGAAVAAVFLVIVITALRSLTRPDVVGAQAVVQAEDGSLNTLPEGETLRTNDRTHVVISLSDSSRVELRSQSELSIQRADDGLRIHLNEGSMVVIAPRPRNGNLYVQTRDLTLSVSGTIFVVTADEAGSRVAVIQGEVRVRQGTTETSLTQGRQLVSNPQMIPQDISDEFAWSRNADAHFDQLQQSQMTLQERCGAFDLRTVVHENGGWNLRLPGVLWHKYRCKREGDAELIRVNGGSNF